MTCRMEGKPELCVYVANNQQQAAAGAKNGQTEMKVVRL